MDFDCAAIKVEYWAEQAGPIGLLDFEGIGEFRAELANNYISNVHARPGPCGGLYGLTVEFLTSFSLQHFLNLIVDGIAYDLVKSAGKALVLRPFIAAYNALKRKNAETGFRIHIDELLLSFQDSVVVIHNLHDDSIQQNLKPVLSALAASYTHLILRAGEKPFSISVPVFEDMAAGRLCRFRELLDVDETIRNVCDEDYMGLWGIQYDYSQTTRVLDVRNQILLDEEFYTRSRYWQVWQDRRQREKASGAKDDLGH